VGGREERTDVDTSLKNKIFSNGPSFTGTWRRSGERRRGGRETCDFRKAEVREQNSRKPSEIKSERSPGGE
jgi:hypothetical protein